MGLYRGPSIKFIINETIGQFLHPFMLLLSVVGMQIIMEKSLIFLHKYQQWVILAEHKQHRTSCMFQNYFCSPPFVQDEDSEQDVDYYRQEVGEEPEPGKSAGEGVLGIPNLLHSNVYSTVKATGRLG